MLAIIRHELNLTFDDDSEQALFKNLQVTVIKTKLTNYLKIGAFETRNAVDSESSFLTDLIGQWLAYSSGPDILSEVRDYANPLNSADTYFQLGLALGLTSLDMFEENSSLLAFGQISDSTNRQDLIVSFLGGVAVRASSNLKTAKQLTS